MNKNKKRKWLSALIVLLFFIAGVGLMLYPTISNYLHEKNQSKAIEDYQRQVANLNEEDFTEQMAQAVIYNETLAGDPVRDPYVLGSGMALPENYEAVLNISGNGVMGYIEIPKIGVHLSIYHGTGESALAAGVGHIEETALPVGGVGNHPVLTGHTGLASAKLFTDLDKLETGDLFYIYVLNESLCYRVDQIEVINPEDLSKLQPDPEQDYVTLLTCTPYAVNTHRLLVRGVRTEYVEPQTLQSEKCVIEEVRSNFELRILVIAVIVFFAVVLLVLILTLIRRKNRTASAPASDRDL